MFRGISCGLFLLDLTFVPQVSLVTYQEYDYIAVGELLERLQPLRYVLEAVHVCDVVNEEGTHRTSVIRRSDRTISLLPGSVPNLCLDGLPIMRADFLGGELYADCGLRFEVEVTLGVSEEQVRFADPRVTDHYDLEKVVIGLILSSFHIMN